METVAFAAVFQAVWEADWLGIYVKHKCKTQNMNDARCDEKKDITLKEELEL